MLTIPADMQFGLGNTSVTLVQLTEMQSAYRDVQMPVLWLVRKELEN